MFIEKNTSLMTNTVVSQPIFYINYQLADFQLELFEQHGIQPNSRILSSVKKRQAEYLAGRLCARSALEAVGVFDFTVLSSTDRAPIWPLNVTGSITHSGSHAAALACSTEHCQGVGVDIEKIIDAQRYDLTKQICSTDELDYLQSQTHLLDFNSLVTLVFSAKESLFKALYPLVRQFFYFDAVRITSIDVLQQSMELCVVNDIVGSVDDLTGDRVESHASSQIRTITAGSCFSCYYQTIDTDYFLTHCVIDHHSV